MITLVAARARNGAIGKDNTIPWHIPEDFRAFQRETTGGAVIMGRNTWESLPKKPLPRRLNIVVTSRGIEGDAETVPSVGAAVRLAQREGYTRIYGIGGARIYSEMLGLADRLVITEVDTEIAQADAFFPDFAVEDWHLLFEQSLCAEPIEAILYEYMRPQTPPQ